MHYFEIVKNYPLLDYVYILKYYLPALFKNMQYYFSENNNNKDRSIARYYFLIVLMERNGNKKITIKVGNETKILLSTESLGKKLN